MRRAFSQLLEGFVATLFATVVIVAVLGTSNAQAQRSNQRHDRRFQQNSSTTLSFPSETRRARVSVLKPRLRISSTTSVYPTRPVAGSHITLSTRRPSQRRFRGGSRTSTTTPSTTQPVDFDLDVLDQSPSDYASFLVWPVPRRQPAKRIRGPVGSTTTTSRPLVKLSQPKPTRPSLYSLDGFVPRPDRNFVFTTEANPTYHVPAFDLQTLGSSFKRKQVNYPNSAEQFERRRNKAYSNSAPEPAGNKKAFRSRFGAISRHGVPGQDYPTFDSVPKTDFDCAAKPSAGRYADTQAGCQVWHLCPGRGFPHRHSFLCPVGTTFNENKGICDWWYNVHCELPTDENYSRRYKRSKDTKAPPKVASKDFATFNSTNIAS